MENIFFSAEVHECSKTAICFSVKQQNLFRVQICLVLLHRGTLQILNQRAHKRQCSMLHKGGGRYNNSGIMKQAVNLLISQSIH